MSPELSDKKARARKWVHGYVAAGTVIVVAAVIPGSTSAALIAMEVTMCYQIGKIYKGDTYDMRDAMKAAKIIGLVAIAAQLVALEALDFVPFAGWAVKAGIAGGVIKALGESIIKYYEAQEIKMVNAGIIDVQATELRVLPPPLLATAIAEVSVETRLNKLAELRNKNLLSQAEYDAKRQKILDDI